jgi:hypothetical protein
MVGECDDVQTPSFCSLQYLEVLDIGLLEITRRWSV